MSQRSERSTQPELDGMTQWLIRHAARQAPPCLTARLEEEWLADLESRSSAASKLRFAVGCCWATMIIVSEHSRGRVLAPHPVTMAKGFIAPADRNFCYFSVRSGTLFLIVGLHAAVFCGLITMLSQTHGSATTANSESRQLKPVSPESEISPSITPLDMRP